MSKFRYYSAQAEASCGSYMYETPTGDHGVTKHANETKPDAVGTPVERWVSRPYPARNDRGMQRIQKYKADDGAEFTTEAACLEYEALCTEIAARYCRRCRNAT